ncbi:MAG: hypothetical protein JNK64_26310 [Myxococcales bacterium]|nr:hypothetical protein [Myxococcales bacterium]
MDPKTKGAWIVNHAQKLDHVTGGAAGEYENIKLAGKMGLMLSSLAASDESTLTTPQVHALAHEVGVSVRLELPTILEQLERQRLISLSPNGLAVLGVTSAMVLSHTAAAFDQTDPQPHEHAVLDIAEKVSQSPLESELAAQYLGDTFKLTKDDTTDLLEHCVAMDFLDGEDLGGGKQLLFNGHIFRRESAMKIQAVLQSLTNDESRKLVEIEQLLRSRGCLPLDEVKRILGEPLFEKLHAIGMLDVSEVANEHETQLYVTRPGAFTKFSNAFIDDAMDLAKAFVACLTYGIMRSSPDRGRITMLTALMRKMLTGAWTGNATAIGEDYRVLERRRVVAIRPKPGGYYEMRLLKRDIGELALQVLTAGDASEHSLPNFPGAAVTRYTKPEERRTLTRRTQAQPSKRATRNVLTALRTGRL